MRMKFTGQVIEPLTNSSRAVLFQFDSENLTDAHGAILLATVKETAGLVEQAVVSVLPADLDELIAAGKTSATLAA